MTISHSTSKFTGVAFVFILFLGIGCYIFCSTGKKPAISSPRKKQANHTKRNNPTQRPDQETTAASTLITSLVSEERMNDSTCNHCLSSPLPSPIVIADGERQPRLLSTAKFISWSKASDSTILKEQWRNTWLSFLQRE